MFRTSVDINNSVPGFATELGATAHQVNLTRAKPQVQSQKCCQLVIEPPRLLDLQRFGGALKEQLDGHGEKLLRTFSTVFVNDSAPTTLHLPQVAFERLDDNATPVVETLPRAISGAPSV